jgi:hypothetical protein
MRPAPVADLRRRPHQHRASAQADARPEATSPDFNRRRRRWTHRGRMNSRMVARANAARAGRRPASAKAPTSGVGAGRRPAKGHQPRLQSEASSEHPRRANEFAPGGAGKCGPRRSPTCVGVGPNTWRWRRACLEPIGAAASQWLMCPRCVLQMFLPIPDKDRQPDGALSAVQHSSRSFPNPNDSL